MPLSFLQFRRRLAATIATALVGQDPRGLAATALFPRGRRLLHQCTVAI